MSEPLSVVGGLGVSSAASCNDTICTRYAVAGILSVAIPLLLLYFTRLFYEFPQQETVDNTVTSHHVFPTERSVYHLQYPQQETGSRSLIQDSMTVVFPQREWKCALIDNMYFPEVLSCSSDEHVLQRPQQETSSSSLIPDSITTMAFPHREWKCSLKDNRYFPVFSIQETGHNKPDELV